MKYRKKPVVIEAIRWQGDNWNEVCDFCFGIRGQWKDNLNRSEDMQVVIHTLEGDMIARIGDYIIKGIKGEFYPCKPDVFAASYEPVVGTLDVEEYYKGAPSDCKHRLEVTP